MSKKGTIIFALLFFAGIALISWLIGIFNPHMRQHNPGRVVAAYRASGAKGDVVIVQDNVSITYASRTMYNSVPYSWLIVLDAHTGKEITRIRARELKYIGSDETSLWMNDADSAVRLNRRDPYTGKVLENYQDILKNIQAKNPALAGNNIADWQIDYGNMLVTGTNGTEYQVNLETSEAIESAKWKRSGLSTLPQLGLLKQGSGRYAYREKKIYALEGQGHQQQLCSLDSCHFSVTDKPGPDSRPYEVLKESHLGDQNFLEAAFVYDAFTKQPLSVSGEKGTYVFHYDRLGNGHHYLISRLDETGKENLKLDVTDMMKEDDDLVEAFAQKGMFYLVFTSGVQAYDASGKLLWTYHEDTLTHD